MKVPMTSYCYLAAQPLPEALDAPNAREWIKQNKLNKKVFYYFAILAIIIEIIIYKNRRIANTHFARLDNRMRSVGVLALLHGNEKFHSAKKIVKKV